MNRGNMERLAAHLDIQGPETFDAAQWCGTACCIAGHAVLLGADEGVSTSQSAQLWLDITGIDANKLFIPDQLDDITAQHAAKMLRRMVAGGNVDWDEVLAEEYRDMP